MRTFGKVLIGIPVAFVAAVGLTLAATSIGNVIATSNEMKNTEPYGELVDVDGKQMNVVVRGSGDETLVLLPGYATAAPGIDFDPLISQLEDDFRVVAIEPLGVGLSDDTDVPRTSENYVSEVHSALHSLGIDKYALVGHSISGVYSLEYANTYPDEVTAFVGIDSSVPNQPDAAVELPIGLMKGMKALGLTRQLDAAGPDPLEGLPYTDEQRAASRALALKHSVNNAFVSETELTGENFENAKGLTFPKTLPVLLIVAEGNDGDVPGWLTLHEEQAASVDNGTVVFMPGDHYLHHEHSPEIAAAIKELLG